MSTDTPQGIDLKFVQMEAEIIFDSQAEADACTRALEAAGFSVVGRPDWNVDTTECAWVMARAITINDDVFPDHIQTIIQPHGGLLWAFGEGWTRNKYASGCADEEQVEQEEILQ